jgi:hypothetical protein
MKAKEYAAGLIREENSPNRFRARGVEFSRIGGSDIDEVDRLISELSSVRTVTSITSNTLRDLRELKHAHERMLAAGALTITGFLDVGNNVDVLLPINYDGTQRFTPLEGRVFSDWKKILEKRGSVKIYNYQGLMDMSAPGDPSLAGEILDDMLGVNAYLFQAGVTMNLLTFTQGDHSLYVAKKESKNSEEDSDEVIQPIRKGSRSSERQMLLDYVKEHGGITVEETSGMLKISEGASYQRLLYLCRQNLLKKTGPRRYVLRSPGEAISTAEAPVVNNTALNTAVHENGEAPKSSDHNSDVIGYRGASRVFEYVKKKSNGTPLDNVYFDARTVQTESREQGTLRYMVQHALVQKGTGPYFGRFRFTPKGISELSGSD